ncbi:lysozyme inhibitor LprI family protein [Rhodoferax sp. GW822-FHT02A01]|uniref:lysozyme inhibitor LprI family protein n=1 Tax=Rhodoferax sp. GW822-FHT02A01 TaxID=3141537 RepID=UPI00315DA94C
MTKAGAIIGIIAGIFGFLAAITTLLFGGLSSAFGAHGANTVIGLGWGGVLFSFATIILGAIAFSRPKKAGIGMIVTSILGAVLGGTLVAVCMVLSLVGGILAVIGAKDIAASTATPVTAGGALPASAASQTMTKRILVLVALFAVGGGAVLLSQRLKQPDGTDTQAPVIAAGGLTGEAAPKANMANESVAVTGAQPVTKDDAQQQSKSSVIETAAAQPIAAQKASWVPSFDCTKAVSFAEKAICSDPLLGKLDGALAENYKFMQAADIGDGAKADLKASQRKWVAERNKCVDNQCLADTYRKRIDDVCDYPVISGAHPACNAAEDIK